MTAKLNQFKYLMMAAVLGVGLLASAKASALGCTNDIDCPEPACGGQVCDWLHKQMTCQPAGNYEKGADGWCTSDSDCKCFAQGARCVSAFCTFVLPSQAPGAAATGGASGATGGATGATGGASAGTGGAAPGGTGGASSGHDGGSQPPKDSGGGGCSVGGAASSSGLVAFGALGALIALARRRRHSR